MLMTLSFAVVIATVCQRTVFAAFVAAALVGSREATVEKDGTCHHCH